MLVIAFCGVGERIGANPTTRDEHNTSDSGMLIWKEPAGIPPVPDPLGVAGAFIGLHNGALILAGGSTFDRPAWENGHALHRNDIHVLLEDAAPGGDKSRFQWVAGGQLPSPLAQGATAATPLGLVCLGGTDGEKCTNQVLLLRWDAAHNTVRIERRLPDLPLACQKLSAAAIVGKYETTIYVAGGLAEEGRLLNAFHCLTLPHDIQILEVGKLQWQTLPSLPGPPRFGAAFVSQRDGSSANLYLCGGKSQHDYLTDAYCYSPDRGKWSAISKLPRPALLAPAIAIGQSHVFLFSGSDGHDVERWQELREEYHFTREVLAYHTITDTWTSAGEMPTGVAATTAVKWNGGVAIPGGELRPTVRTRDVQFARIKTTNARFGRIDLLVLGLCLVLLLGVGLYFSLKEHSVKDFFLAGGRIPWWAAGLSLMATQVSSIGFLAIPAKSFATNWTYFVGVLTWFLVVPIVTRVYIPFLRSLDVTTAYEYLEARFNYGTRLIAALAYCLLQLGRMGVVVLLPALTLSTVTGLDEVHCILVMGVVATVYTVAGGMEAVVWTDVIQAILLMGGAIVCVAVVIIDTPGGWTGAWNLAVADGKMQSIDWRLDPTQAVLWVVVIGNVLTRLSGLTADQAVVQRYLTTKDAPSAARALWLDVAVSIPWAIVVFGLGTSLYVFYKNNPNLLSPAAETDAIVSLFIAQQLPTGVAGLIVAAIFAAAMSSLDSAMHSVSTVYLTDVHSRLWPRSSERQRLWLARVVTAALGCFGTAMALYMAALGVLSLWDVFLALVGAVVGILGGLFLLGMFTTRTNSSGAIVGAIFGATTMYAVESYTRLSFFLFPVVGIASCFVVGYLASLCLPGQGRTAELTVYTRAKH